MTDRTRAPRSGRGQAVAALLTAGTLWGASFAVGKVALEEVTPSWLIAVRFAMASAVLLPLVPWRRVALGAAEWRLILAGAVLAGPIMFVLQFEGLARTTASSAALLVAVAPPLLAVSAALVDGERADRATWAAVALSAVGVVLLVGAPGPGRTLLGDALCALSMVGATAWTLVSRRLARRIGALPAVALQFAVGAGLVTLLALARDGVPALPSAAAWGAVVFLGLGCTALTFVLWNWGLMHIEAARAGVIANVEPVVGTLIGVLWLGDRLGPLSVVGGALLVVAAVVVSRGGAPRRGARARTVPQPIA